MASRLAVQACNCIIHGFTIGDFLGSEVERDIDVLEFWAGVASITRAAKARGLRAEMIEKECGGVGNNLLSLEGFRRAVDLTLRLKPGGLLLDRKSTRLNSSH